MAPSNPSQKSLADHPFIVLLGAIAALVTILLGLPAILAYLATLFPAIDTNTHTPTALPTPNSAHLDIPAYSAAGVPATIFVHKGDVLSITASGTWCWGGDVDCSDPSGTFGRPSGPQEGVPTLEGQHFGTLIGRVGGWLFPIGVSANVTVEADGELVLLMNDRKGSYGDNSRSITVDVTVKRNP
jgi:hypothetical protein